MSKTTPCHCGAECQMDHDGGECWGQVGPVDEVQCDTEEDPDWIWVHSCEGHWDMYEGGKYKEQKTPLDSHTPTTDTPR